MSLPSDCRHLPERAATTWHPSSLCWHFAAMFAVAAVLRLANLGCFSLWLDEVLQVERSRGSLAEAWRPTGLDVHPPLSALVMWVGYRLGLTDTLQRLVSAGLGVLSILLLTAWARRRFGDVVAVTAGWLAALSPFHLRYSQELRPYPYLLFFVTLSLVVVDRAVKEGRLVWTVPCGIVFAGGLYSHALFPLVAAPIAASALLLDRPARRNALRTLPLAAGIGLALFAPWIPHLLTVATASAEPSAQTWTAAALARRWQFLTLGGWEGADLTWGDVLLGVLALLGVVRAIRLVRQGGLEVIVGALVGAVGVELLFHSVWHRWSVGRYSVVGWPFLVLLVALGLGWFWERKTRGLGAAIVVAITWCLTGGLGEYYTRGREHWDRMVDVIRAVHRPGEPVLTESLFCQATVEHYLHRPGTSRDAGAAGITVLPLDRNLERLRALWPPDGACLLVRGGAPQSPQLRRLASHFPVIATYSDSSWLYRLPPQSRVEWDDSGRLRLRQLEQGTPWPPPSLVLLPPSLRDPRQLCMGRLWRALRSFGPAPETHLLEFDAATSGRALLSGWGGFETTPDGTTFVWATAVEAGIVFVCAAPRPTTLRVVLWPFQVPDQAQRVRGFLNQHVLGQTTLKPGSQTVEVAVAPAALRRGENLLVFQFAYAVAPAEVHAGSHDWRSLACGFDRLELVYRCAGPPPARPP